MSASATQVCKECGEELDEEEFRKIYIGQGKYYTRGKCNKCIRKYERRLRGGTRNKTLTRAQIKELFAEDEDEEIGGLPCHSWI